MVSVLVQSASIHSLMCTHISKIFPCYHIQTDTMCIQLARGELIDKFIQQGLIILNT